MRSTVTPEAGPPAVVSRKKRGPPGWRTPQGKENGGCGSAVGAESELTAGNGPVDLQEPILVFGRQLVTFEDVHEVFAAFDSLHGQFHVVNAGERGVRERAYRCERFDHFPFRSARALDKGGRPPAAGCDAARRDSAARPPFFFAPPHCSR